MVGENFQISPFYNQDNLNNSCLLYEHVVAIFVPKVQARFSSVS